MSERGAERPGRVAAVRGAVSVPANSAEHILEATARLLGALMETNQLEKRQLVSVLFTATSELDADYPAHAARRLGWTDVPLLCAREIEVPGSLPRIVRVMLTVRDAPARLEPVYLDAARALRPDLGREARAASGAAAHRIAIVGLGQIGGSLGLALGATGGWARIGFDLDAETGRLARAAGAVDDVAGSLEQACSGVEIAVLAVPVDALAGTIERVASALPAGAALLDTGSARSGLATALERARARGVRAIGGHPLAGSEGRGFAAARADLFRGAPFVVLPGEGEIPDVVRALLAALGAREVISDAREHDRALARTSHLPYLVARALVGVGGDADRRALAGPGFRSMTRLAASDPRMAGAYCRANAREIRPAWEELREAIEREVREVEAEPPA